MIVKIPPKRRDSKSSFEDLASYITEELNRDEIDIGRPGFGNLTQYITRESVPDILSGLTVEKTIGVEIGNLNSLATAAQEMYAVAEKNRRSEDPVFHYIISWPQNERPEVKDMMAAARDTLAAIGLADHQYIIAIHANTDNLHAHIEVNRIHPTTFKAHHIEWAQKTLHRAAREAEIKYGWQHDNGLYEVVVRDGQKVIVSRAEVDEADKVQGKSATFEIWNGEESLETWCRTKPGAVLKRFLPTATSWDDIHEIMNGYGLELVNSGGGGMQVRTLPADGSKPVVVSASKAFRFMKRKELEERFGPFTLPGVLTNEGDSTDDYRIDREQYERDQRRREELGITIRNSVPKSFFENHRRQAPAADGGDLLDLSDVPMVHDLDGSEMLLPGDAHDLMENDATRTNNVVRRSIPGAERGINRAPQVTYKRDPEKRLQAKQERAEKRQALLARFEKEKVVHRAVRKQMQDELKERYKTRFDAISNDRKSARLSIRNNPLMPAKEKQQAYSLLAHQMQVRKERVEQAMREEKRHLAEVFKALPISSWRSWVEELAQSGDEDAIAALRGIIYQEGRDRKKKADAEGEGQEVEAKILAPVGGTHDPRRAADLRWRLHSGRLYFNFDDGRFAFVDNGESISWDRALVDDDALRLSLKHAAEKWGKKLAVQGGDAAFQTRLLDMADELGIKITNLTRSVDYSGTTKAPIGTPTPLRPNSTAPVRVRNPESVSTLMPAPVDVDLQNMMKAYPKAATIDETAVREKPFTYKGKIVAVNGKYVAQEIAPGSIVLHSRQSIPKVPAPGRRTVEIQYDSNNAVSITTRGIRNRRENNR